MATSKSPAAAKNDTQAQKVEHGSSSTPAKKPPGNRKGKRVEIGKELVDFLVWLAGTRSAEELHADTGLHKDSLDRWSEQIAASETGRISVTTSQLVTFCWTMKCSADDIFLGDSSFNDTRRDVEVGLQSRARRSRRGHQINRKKFEELKHLYRTTACSVEPANASPLLEATTAFLRARDIAFQPLPEQPTVEDLESRIEAVFMACHSEKYDVAWDIAWNEISQRDRLLLVELHAYDVSRNVAEVFFTDQSFTSCNVTDDPIALPHLLRTIAWASRNLGQTRRADEFFKKAADAYAALCVAPGMEAFAPAMEGEACLMRLHRAECLCYLDQLPNALTETRGALRRLKRREHRSIQYSALGHQGYAGFLSNNGEVAARAFGEMADKPVDDVETGLKRIWLQSAPQIWFAEYLIAKRDWKAATKVLVNVRRICQTVKYMPDDYCHMLALDGWVSDHTGGGADFVRAQFSEAVAKADEIGNVPEQLFTRLQRAKWLMTKSNRKAAEDDVHRIRELGRDGFPLYARLSAVTVPAD